MYVRQKYPADRVYLAEQGVAATGLPMDLALPPATVVGVIKEGDPMGNKDRWFVDNGGELY